jgi:predicted nuclease of predicted toxin-antitoxin system
VRLLADENFPRLLVQRLRERGHDVRWIREEHPGVADEVVLRRAREESRVIATFDKDFGELAFRERLPASCGILLLRLSGVDPESLARRAVLAIESRADWSGCFAVLEGDRVRVRRLPLG